MADSRNTLRRLVEGLSEIFGYVSGLAILCATLIIVEQVVLRYIFKTPTIWQVETAVYLLIAATFLGASYGLKQNAHINIDILVILLPGRFRKILAVITAITSLAFCLFLAWRGAVMWWEAYSGGWHSSSLLGVPLIYPYGLIPLGMALTSFQYVIRIADMFKALKEDKPYARRS